MPEITKKSHKMQAEQKIMPKILYNDVIYYSTITYFDLSHNVITR